VSAQPVRALLCIAPTAPVTHAYTGSRSNNSTRLCSQPGYINAAPRISIGLFVLDLLSVSFFLTGFYPIDYLEKAAQLTNFAILPVAVTEAEQSSRIRYSISSIMELRIRCIRASSSTL
jgi:hypothetical protein